MYIHVSKYVSKGWNELKHTEEKEYAILVGEGQTCKVFNVITHELENVGIHCLYFLVYTLNLLNVIFIILIILRQKRLAWFIYWIS